MINNSNDLNTYYKLINQYIDEYIDKGIKPSKLNKYLNKNNLQNFLERRGLKNIIKIDQVVKDVLEDRVALERDSIMKFESFQVFESYKIQFNNIKECLYKNIGKSNITHEKILADFYDVSLSQIDIINSEEHIFKINNFNQEFKCIVYTLDELSIISENLKELINQKMMEENIQIDYKIQIPVKEFIDSSKLEEYLNKYLNPEMVKNIIWQVLSCEMEVKSPNFIGTF